ncbi:hypothetical protein [Flaviaesturariibacter amylovorans]|uniref:Uncharacterized protein n=1 Tax=Flaviaesturariibacter amylovorans TaxID=1084520 RepID=A0ABP8H579_9BACT
MTRIAQWFELNAELVDLTRQFAEGVRQKVPARQLQHLNSRIRETLEHMRVLREEENLLMQGWKGKITKEEGKEE